MNKTELISELQEILDSKAQAEKAYDSLVNAITRTLVDGHSVTITGFGTFKAQKRDARKGRNPQTGETIDIPARTVVKFTPGKALKEAVQ